MSTRYSSQELPQTEHVRKPLRQLKVSQSSAARRARSVTGNGLKPAVKQETHPVTHRLRLFEYHCEELGPGERIYVEVWDTPQQPVDTSSVLHGKPVRTFQNDSQEIVEIQAQDFCRRELGNAEIVDWRDISSI
jgi:hypothetical protein